MIKHHIQADKNGPLFTKSAVDDMALRMIAAGDFFNRKAHFMTVDAQKAIELTDDVNARFSKTLDTFTDTTTRFAKQAKTASGGVRDAADKLAAGLSRIEKAANFDRLERYVELLERAAKAMETLAVLEQSGRLDKIAAAIR
jgi:hypothetical protein